ncbi:Major facilitator superfamily transporter, partial [Metarhizium brunneum ARSEF 3297]
MEEVDATELKSNHADNDVAATEELTPEENKRLLRRIDLYLLPIMAASYMFQFLGTSAIGFTAILGLREDLHLSGTDFSWANSTYYFGFLIAAYPASMIMVRWRVGKMIAVAVVLWGAVLMLTAVTTKAADLLALRFFLGVCESPIAPGLTAIVAMWYKRSEQPLRHAAWFTGNTIAGIAGGLASYGIGHMDSIAPWKAVFFIFGGSTVAWSICLFFLLPDVPMTAWFMSKQDRRKAIQRVKENMTGIKSSQFKWKQCREAALDAKTWFIVVIQLCGSIPSGGVHSFGVIIIHGLGFDTFPTLLLQTASYVVSFALVLLATAGSTYLRNTRTYFMAWNFCVAIAGCVVIRQCSVEQKWARYAGFCLVFAYVANFPLLMSMASGNFGGFTKKMTVNAFVRAAHHAFTADLWCAGLTCFWTGQSFIAYCTGNIIGPQLFFAKEAPTYSSGLLAMLICFGIGLVSCMAFRFHLMWENRRRDQACDVPGRIEMENADLMDRTDKDISQFRYVY